MRPLLSLLLAALFAACSNPPADLPDDTPASSLPEPDSDLPSDASARAKLRPADAAATAQLSSFKVHDGLGNTGPFELAALQALSIETLLVAPSGKHTVQVDLFDPHGSLYGSLRTTLLAGADGRVSSTQIFQVRGTAVEQYHMTGTWQLVLLVDAIPLASATAEVVE